MYGTPSSSTSQYSDLAGLGRILSRIEVGPLLALFTRKPGRGRQPYDRLPIIYALLACYLLNIQTIQALVNRLNNDPALRRVCGFHGRIPHRSTFSRSFSVLAAHQEILYHAFEELTRQILALTPDMGKLLAVDSTVVAAWANPNKKKTRDPEAGWTKSYSASSTSDDGMEWVYGYKAHVLTSVDPELPLAFFITPANRNDSPTLLPLVDMARRSYLIHPEALMADRGYDSRANSNALHKQDIAPIIPRRDPKQRAEGKPVWSLHGHPSCIGSLDMEYIGTDRQTGCHGFKCPAGGCYRRQESFKGYTVCDDVVWESPDENVYEVGGRISRASPLWQILYNLRWSIERYFGLVKDNGWIEEHRFRGLARVGLHITLAFLMHQATVLDGMAGDSMQAPLRGFNVV